MVDVQKRAEAFRDAIEKFQNLLIALQNDNSLIPTLGFESNEEFVCRVSIKQICTTIEGSIHAFKEMILALPADVLSSEQLFILKGKSLALDDTGNIRQGDQFYTTKAYIRFVLDLSHKVLGLPAINYGDNNWFNLLATIKIRNRLTHPKDIEDLKVTLEEVIKGLAASGWLMDNIKEVLSKIKQVLTTALE